MHAERDWLVKRVFPALRQRLEPHRIHLVDIDLRWGVTREQSDNDRVLGLCLAQIEECRPFFRSSRRRAAERREALPKKDRPVPKSAERRAG